MPDILVVDDEKDIRRAIEYILAEEGYTVDLAANGQEALALLGKKEYDLVITDLKMPGGADGFAVLRQTKEISPGTAVIMITAFGSIDSAVEAMKMGADDYVVKPFQHDAIILTIRRALERATLTQENQGLKRQLSQRLGYSTILGVSEAISRVFTIIEKVAPTRANVFLTGESGTGKGLIAETIHNNSPRRDKLFLSINCAAIPETLLESELFGYKKGAFTGAGADKTGLMVMANNGTLFLDEIGDMPAVIQAKILKVLESGEVLPLGDTRTKKIDVRLISATNKDLEACIREKSFREDLYYRLNVVEIRIPPLRERRDDIPLLARAFLAEEAGRERSGKTPAGFDNNALRVLVSYSWPGNVRELRNVVERALIFASGDTVTMADLPPKIALTAAGTENSAPEEETSSLPLKTMINNYERDILVNALHQFDGNKEMIARTLGMDLTTLYRKMHKFHIDEESLTR